MFVVRGTREFLDRVGRPLTSEADTPTTALGDWFANVWFWRPHVALFINVQTLLPVLVPLAPAATVVARFVDALGDALEALETDPSFIECEVAKMTSFQLATTNSRSVLGTMNDFKYMAESYREQDGSDDLLALALRLAHTPCRVHSRGAFFPDRELAEFVTRSRGG